MSHRAAELQRKLFHLRRLRVKKIEIKRIEDRNSKDAVLCFLTSILYHLTSKKGA